MSAEHQGPSGGRKDSKKSGAKPPRVGSSLTDAVVAALAKVDDKKDKPAVVEAPAPAEAGCAATSAPSAAAPPPAVAAVAVAAVEPPVVEPPVVEPPAVAVNGVNGFHRGPGSFVDLVARWSGAAPMTPVHAAPAAAPVAPAVAASPVAAPVAPPAVSAPVAVAPAAVAPAAVAPAAVAESTVPAAALAALAATVDLPPSQRESAPAPVPQRKAGTGPVRVRYYGRTDVGLVREHNEDNFAVVDLDAGLRGTDAPREVQVGARGCIFAVCDGMGGAAAGEVASQMAVDTIHEVFSQGENTKDRDAFARRVVHAVEEAGHRIFSAAKMDRTRRGMGTTTTLAGLADNVLFVGQVGDSRAYILRGDQLALITKDQSLVNQLIEAGQLTEEEAEAFEHSNIILQALGTTEEVTVDLTFIELRRGDRLLMCSDGLSGLVHAEMIREVMQTTPDLSDAAGRLIQMANGGGGHDNITIILADFDGDGLAAADGVPVRYQQYPLPPDDTVRGQALAPRDTAIKSGGPKPGADVKREDSDATVAETSTEGKSKVWLLALVAFVLIALIGGAIVVLGGFLDGGDTPTPELTQRPDTARVPPPLPQANDRANDVGDRLGNDVVNDTHEVQPPPAVTQGTVTLATDLEGATLWVNGQARGPLTDGATLQLAPGPYTLEARAGGATASRANITVVAGEQVSAELNAERGADPPVANDPPRIDPVRPEPRDTPRPTKRDRPRVEVPTARPLQGGGPSTPTTAPPRNPFD